MIKSMTGYGRGECLLYCRKIVVELKSVNHRYNDFAIKMPRVMNCLEDKLKKLLSAHIQRGKTDVYVSMETFSDSDVKINVNEPLANAYVEALIDLKQRFNISSEIPLQLVATYSDVLSIEKNIYDETAINEMWETLEAAAKEAIDRFISMRISEGEALKENILDKKAFIVGLVEKLEKRMPFVVLDYEKRLKLRITELLENIQPDENRLLTEIAVFAERSCVDEELTRLKSHLNQLDLILSQNETVGRKLDFLMQEMNREINTIGSKSNDLEMNRLVVDLKCEVEKIREQIQNIE